MTHARRIADSTATPTRKPVRLREPPPNSRPQAGRRGAAVGVAGWLAASLILLIAAIATFGGSRSAAQEAAPPVISDRAARYRQAGAPVRPPSRGPESGAPASVAPNSVAPAAGLQAAGGENRLSPENSSAVAGAADARRPSDVEVLAQRVSIRRDAFGVPTVQGEDDQATLFGFAFAQAEDHFWQIEDSYILGLGRYAEVHGPAGLNSDLLNRLFEIASRAPADFAGLDGDYQQLAAAYVAGLNYYLACHPEVQPRLIRRFEPWHTLAFARMMLLETTYRYTRRSNSMLPRMHARPWTATGSNAWALSPRRTASGRAMLMASPHQPWFGYGQLYEARLISGSDWEMSGPAALGSFFPCMGHNGRLGWALTTNEPDIADVWRVTFDHPHDPLLYRYDGGWRRAEEWSETVQIAQKNGLESRTFVFRKTHHGPVIEKLDDGGHLAARIAGLYECRIMRQVQAMIRSRNLTEFRDALRLQDFPLMNVVYADDQGDIAFFYNGRIPRRDPSFDWTQPVDGADPRTQWQGFHDLDELPFLINPPDGYIQNCNSSPFTTCESGNPRRTAYPPYMLEDADRDLRRARMSRRLLSTMQGVTFEQFQAAAFDTTVFWAVEEFPQYETDFSLLADRDPELARRVAPYWRRLQAWDRRISERSTAATLCEAWYRELYQGDYPGEDLKEQYRDDRLSHFRGLLNAAAGLQRRYGQWQVPWGDVHRLQRHPQVADLLRIPFDDALPSVPCLGAPGPLGTIFTQYYLPPVELPLLATPQRLYGVVGKAYLGVYEFGPQVRAVSLSPMGQSGSPDSPHYWDQAPLLSQRKLKPEPQSPAGAANVAREYRPGAAGAPRLLAAP